MKFLLIIPVRIYWLLGFRSKRNCLFRESCSHHVYRITQERGFFAGVSAFLKRFRVCRPGYWIVPAEKELIIKFNDGTQISQSDASLTLLAPYQRAVQQVEHSYKNGPDLPSIRS